MTSRRVSVKIDSDPSGFNRGVLAAEARLRAFSNSLNTASDRSTNLVQSITAIAPAAVPIAAAAVPAVAGLTTQLGFAAAGAATAVLAFQGVGDSLKALNEAQLNPTAENVAKLNEEFAKIGPSGREFVLFLDELRGPLETLQDVAQEGLFPGAQEGIEDLMTLLPQVQQIIGEIADASGDLLAEAGENLAGPRFEEFFTYLATEARPILTDLGQTIGNLFEALTQTWMAFDPLSDSFSQGLLSWSQNLAEASRSLSESEGFQGFISYIQEQGPAAVDALAAIGDALVSLIQAAAPVGAAVLPIIEAIANTLSVIADSPAGPVLIGAAAGISAISRAVALYNMANGTALSALLGTVGGQGAQAGGGARIAAAGIGVLALSLTDLDEKANLSNTAMFAMLGALAGPWGAAIGAAVGAVTDATSANNDLADSVARAETAINTQSMAYEAQVEAVRAAREEFARLQDDLTSSNLGEQVANWFDPGAYKNTFEGIFGASDLEEAEAAVADLEAGLSDLAPTTNSVAEAWERHESAVMANVEAMRALREEALRAANAELNFEEALLDAAKAAREHRNVLTNNGEAQKGQRRAAIEARRELLSLAGAWNELSDKAQNVPGAFRGAIDSFADAAVKMGMSRKAARDLAKSIMEIPTKREVQISAETAAAEAAIARIQAMQIANKTFSVTAVYGTAGSTYDTRPLVGGGRYDKGGFTPKGGKHQVAGIVHAGEFVADQELTEKYGALFAFLHAGGELPGFASGGMVGPKYTLDQTRDILNLEQQIRQLQRDLAKTGEQALKGLEITIAQTELEIAARDLRKARRAPIIEQREGLRETIGGLRDARQGFDVDGDMSVGDVRRELREFERDVKEAGGEWTKQMERTGDRLLRQARAINDAERSIERETLRRDRLQDKLDATADRFADLSRTMDAFGQSVSRNFLSDPFNGGYTVRESVAGGVTPIVPDPALVAARDQLGAAEARLAGIYGRTDMDPLQRSYLASKAVAEVAELRSQVEMLDRGTSAIGDAADPVERTVSGMEALRETLERETKAALDFAAALGTLRANGLDATGPFGGLFASLAQSGDLGTAQELAKLTPEELDEFEKMFAAREDAAAELAAYTVQEVYGEQAAMMQKALDAQTRQLERASDRIDRQTNRLENRIENLQETNRQGFQLVGNQMGELRQDVQQQARQIETIRQKANDGGKRGGRRS